MENISLDEKQNMFEGRISQYSKANVGVQDGAKANTFDLDVDF